MKNIMVIGDLMLDEYIHGSINRMSPEAPIPIVDLEHLEISNTTVILIFAWNFSKMIIDKTKHLNCKYLVAFPKVQLVNSYEELKGYESI